MCIVQEYIHIFYQCVADRNLKPTHIENLLKYYWRYVRVCVSACKIHYSSLL